MGERPTDLGILWNGLKSSSSPSSSSSLLGGEWGRLDLGGKLRSLYGRPVWAIGPKIEGPVGRRVHWRVHFHAQPWWGKTLFSVT